MAIYPDRLSELGELRILVHPLFKMHRDNQAFLLTRQGLFDHACDLFVPNRYDEALAVMPIFYTRPNLGTQLRDAGSLKRATPQAQGWVDLYKAIRTKSLFPGNIVLVEDFVFLRDVSVLPEALKRRGLVIGPQTQITVGGEWVEACIQTTIEKVLALPMVRKVRLDTRVALYLYSNVKYNPPTFRSLCNVYKDRDSIIWTKRT